MRRTKEQAEETRCTILASAEELFLRKGYENVSLDEIAAASGVTRGAVHWHFRNKKGLLFALREVRGLPLQELADRLTEDPALDPLSELGEMMSLKFRLLQEDPRQRRMLKVLLHLDSFDDAEALREGLAFHQRLRMSLTRIFEAAARDKKMPPGWTPCSAAMAFQAVISGLINEWARGIPDFELVPDGEIIVRLVLSSWDLLIKPAAPAPRQRDRAQKPRTVTSARRRSSARSA